jgi:hypothetical protein
MGKLAGRVTFEWKGDLLRGVFGVFAHVSRMGKLAGRVTFEWKGEFFRGIFYTRAHVPHQ